MIGKRFCILLLGSLLLFGCGSKSSGKKSNPSDLPGNLELGVSSETEVETEMGPADTEYTTHDTKVLTYSGTSLQFRDDKLDGHFKNPKDDEVHLQYWLQKWKDQTTLVSAMPETKNAHGQNDHQMTNQKEKTTIIYNQENGIVKRVMFYEK